MQLLLCSRVTRRHQNFTQVTASLQIYKSLKAPETAPDQVKQPTVREVNKTPHMLYPHLVEKLQTRANAV